LDGGAARVVLGVWGGKERASRQKAQDGSEESGNVAWAPRRKREGKMVGGQPIESGGQRFGMKAQEVLEKPNTGRRGRKERHG